MQEIKEISIVPTVSQNQVYIPTPEEWNFMVEWGKQAIQSGMLPSSIRSGTAAAIIVLKGRELGLSFMTAIAHIHVINGKPSMSAELMQGLARKNLPGLVINVLEATSEKAIVELKRPEPGSKTVLLTFSMQDAKTADLLKNPSWQKYPRAMLWSRAISALLRMTCPEALMGISYTPEELGAEVNESGDVIDTTGKKVPTEHLTAAEDKAPPSPIVTKLNAMAELKQLRQDLDLPIENVKQLMAQELGHSDTSKMSAEDIEKIIEKLTLKYNSS